MIEQNLVLDGYRLHYRSAGSGPPLLLLHALGESSYSWTTVLAGLAAAHTVLAPDLPGFAGSEPLPGRPTPQRLALAPPDWIAEHRRLARVPHHRATTLAALRVQVSALGQRQVLLPVLPRLSLPTLLLWGADDRVVPVGQARHAVAWLVRGHVDIVPRCGHFPQLERPERFLAAIDRFIEKG